MSGMEVVPLMMGIGGLAQGGASMVNAIKGGGPGQGGGFMDMLSNLNPINKLMSFINPQSAGVPAASSVTAPTPTAQATPLQLAQAPQQAFQYQPASSLGQPPPPPASNIPSFQYQPASPLGQPPSGVPQFRYQPTTALGQQQMPAPPTPPAGGTAPGGTASSTQTTQKSPYSTAMGAAWDVYKFQKQEKRKALPAPSPVRMSQGSPVQVRVGQKRATGDPLERYARMLKGF